MSALTLATAGVAPCPSCRRPPTTDGGSGALLNPVGLTAAGAVAGATAYVVAHDFPADATGKGGWHSLPHRGATLTQTGATATVAGLTPAAAATARFRVQARNATGLSLPSLPVTATPANP